MILVHRVKDGYYAESKEVQPGEAVSPGWVFDRLPELKENEYAYWNAGWFVTTVPPMPEMPDCDPEKVIWNGVSWDIIGVDE
jgi:hypothetical protein